MGDESEIIAAEPGDEIHVTDPTPDDPDTSNVSTDDGDVNDTDVEIEDHSFNTDTDESVNVNVNVEAPEGGENDNALLAVMQSIDNKLDAVIANTTISAVADIGDIEDENNPPPPATTPPATDEIVIVDGTAEGEPADVKDINPEVTETEAPKRKRRIGR